MKFNKNFNRVYKISSLLIVLFLLISPTNVMANHLKSKHHKRNKIHEVFVKPEKQAKAEKEPEAPINTTRVYAKLEVVRGYDTCATKTSFDEPDRQYASFKEGTYRYIITPTSFKALCAGSCIIDCEDKPEDNAFIKSLRIPTGYSVFLSSQYLKDDYIQYFKATNTKAEDYKVNDSTVTKMLYDDTYCLEDFFDRNPFATITMVVRKTLKGKLLDNVMSFKFALNKARIEMNAYLQAKRENSKCKDDMNSALEILNKENALKVTLESRLKSSQDNLSEAQEKLKITKKYIDDNKSKIQKTINSAQLQEAKNGKTNERDLESTISVITKEGSFTNGQIMTVEIYQLKKQATLTGGIVTESENKEFSNVEAVNQLYKQIEEAKKVIEVELENILQKASNTEQIANKSKNSNTKPLCSKENIKSLTTAKQEGQELSVKFKDIGEACYKKETLKITDFNQQLTAFPNQLAALKDFQYEISIKRNSNNNSVNTKAVKYSIQILNKDQADEKKTIAQINDILKKIAELENSNYTRVNQLKDLADKTQNKVEVKNNKINWTISLFTQAKRSPLVGTKVNLLKSTWEQNSQPKSSINHFVGNKPEIKTIKTVTKHQHKQEPEPEIEEKEEVEENIVIEDPEKARINAEEIKKVGEYLDSLDQEIKDIESQLKDNKYKLNMQNARFNYNKDCFEKSKIKIDESLTRQKDLDIKTAFDNLELSLPENDKIIRPKVIKKFTEVIEKVKMIESVSELGNLDATNQYLYDNLVRFVVEQVDNEWKENEFEFIYTNLKKQPKKQD